MKRRQESDSLSRLAGSPLDLRSWLHLARFFSSVNVLVVVMLNMRGTKLFSVDINYSAIDLLFKLNILASSRLCQLRLLMEREAVCAAC